MDETELSSAVPCNEVVQARHDDLPSPEKQQDAIDQETVGTYQSIRLSARDAHLQEQAHVQEAVLRCVSTERKCYSMVHRLG